jgi:hypothetical protein
LLVLLREGEAVLLQVAVEATLHQELLGQPEVQLFRGSPLEIEPQVEQVPELVVLEDVYYGLLGAFALGCSVHHAHEAIVRGLFTVASVGNAEVKQGLDLLWELRKLHEEVLLPSHPEEDTKVYFSKVQHHRIRVITNREVEHIIVVVCISCALRWSVQGRCRTSRVDLRLEDLYFETEKLGGARL